VHLTRIYRKLGLTSRAALAKLVTELNITAAQAPAWTAEPARTGYQARG